MQNDTLVLTIAQAILANIKVLQTLVDTLPKATQVAVAEQVTKATPVASPVQVVAPDTRLMTNPVAPVVAAPVVPTPAIPVPVAVTIPAPVVAPPVAVAPPIPAVVAPPAAVSLSNPPFVDQKGMIKWIMDTYKLLGPSKGGEIQGVLTSLGIGNINEVNPAQYAALYAGVEALK